MDERILYFIWLSNVLKPGNKCIKPLFEAFGNIKNIYNATNEQYKEAGFNSAEVSALSNKDLTLAESQYNYCKREKIGFICFDDPFYPERLKIIQDPPCMFYYRGRLLPLDDYPCVAMVGTRSCTPDGYRFAYKTAYCASSGGAVIVNGLAAGIDGACIAAALDANGYAIGLLGSGIDRIYPLCNKDLFYRLSASGLILTEFPPFTEPKGFHFPIRNRVISALTLATVVYEADADRSGAMITARHAVSQGRQIFAVPGSPDDKNYSGALELIKDGATVLTDADDILTEYSLMFPHRINTRHRVYVPEELMEKYVNAYFDKKNSPKKQSQKNSEKSFQKNQSFDNPGTVQVQTSTVNVKNEKERYVESQVLNQPNDTIQNDNELQSQATIRDLSLLSNVERQIYDLFEEKISLSADEIASHGIKIQDVLSAITLLEVYGFIKAVPGGRFEFIK